MDRGFLSKAVTTLFGKPDADETLRRIRKELARRRTHDTPRRDLIAVLAGTTDVQHFFRQLNARRRR